MHSTDMLLVKTLEVWLQKTEPPQAGGIFILFFLLPETVRLFLFLSVAVCPVASVDSTVKVWKSQVLHSSLYRSG
jgi:hypothetical protein